MKEKISKATPEQWEEIAKLKQEWIDLQCQPTSDDEIRKVIDQMWSNLGYTAPEVRIFDSWKKCCIASAWLSKTATLLSQDAFEEKVSSLSNKEIASLKLRKAYEDSYISLWTSTFSAWYLGAKILGSKFDEKLLQTFVEWSRTIQFVIPFDKIAFVSRKPIAIHWKDGLLHNDSGLSVEFRDKTGLWSIDGFRVNEQIVMRPETQTIDQILNEKNEDIRAIRIQRFGWLRFLQETKSQLIHENFNEIENQHEALFSSPLGTRLVVTCPTGRVFSLSLDPNIEFKTCQEAQDWRAGGKNFRVLGRT